MTHDEFLSLVRQPETVKAQYQADLKEMIELFPYFVPARMLFAKVLKTSNSIHYESNVKVASLYSPSRRWLYYYLHPDKMLSNEPYQRERTGKSSGGYFDMIDVVESKGGDTKQSLKNLADRLKSARAMVMNMPHVPKNNAEKGKKAINAVNEVDEIKAIRKIKAVKEIDEIKAVNAVDEIKAIRKIKAVKEIDEIKAVDEVDEIKAIREIKAVKAIVEIKAIREIDEIKVLSAVNEIKEVEEPIFLKQLSNTAEVKNKKYVSEDYFSSIELEISEINAIKLISERKYRDAIVILKQLNLNNPKKSVYFADQIRFLEKVIETSKK